MSRSSLPFSFVAALAIYACYGEEITGYNVTKIDKVCFRITTLNLSGLLFVLEICLYDWLIPLYQQKVFD